VEYGRKKMSRVGEVAVGDGQPVVITLEQVEQEARLILYNKTRAWLPFGIEPPRKPPTPERGDYTVYYKTEEDIQELLSIPAITRRVQECRC
jgi:hypothetical protein